MPTVTYEDFEQQAWDAAPPIRKRVVGRKTFGELLRAAVASWSGDYVNACTCDTQRRQYAVDLLEFVKIRHQAATGATQAEYGFIWVFLLSAAASALIQWLIQRWLDRHFTAEDIAAWRQEGGL